MNFNNADEAKIWISSVNAVLAGRDNFSRFSDSPAVAENAGRIADYVLEQYRVRLSPKQP